MFYSNFVLVKKGPLSKIWLAAHWQKKITKQHVAATNIHQSAKSILQPTSPLALRLSGQLLLGLVRIYERKVKYLQEDCSDALTKMKMVFRRGTVNDIEEHTIAREGDITLADNYEENVELDVPDLDADNLDELALYQGFQDSFLYDSAEGQDKLMANIDDITLTRRQQADEFALDLEGGEEMGLDLDFGDELVPFMLEDSEEKYLDTELEVGRDAGAQPDFDFLDNTLDLGDKAELVLDGKDALDQSSRADLDLSLFDNDDGDGLGDLFADDGDTDLSHALEQKNDKEADLSSSSSSTTKRTRKRKAIELDDRAEISGALIKEGLRDVTDITRSRRCVPLTARAKKRTKLTRSHFDEMLRAPSTSAFTLSFGNTQLLAPELASLVQEKVSLTKSKQTTTKADANASASMVFDDQDPDFGFEGNDELDFGGFDDDAGLNVSLDTTMDGNADLQPDQFDLDLNEEKNEPLIDDSEEDEEDSLEEKKGGADSISSKQGWSRRTQKMHQKLKNEMETTESVNFNKMCQRTTAGRAARLFYQLLVLKTHKYIHVDQEEPYGDIIVSRDDNFEVSTSA